MGLVKAIRSAIGGGFADQWLEVIEPDDMGKRTVFTSGVQTRRGANVKGSPNTVSNGSVIHVYPNQFMILTDGGKIVDYTAEEGYYTVNDSSLPSLFNGEFGETLKESFRRIKYGGVTPGAQKVFYINLQEITGIKFGTRNAVNYFDPFYGIEMFIRAHGTYSVKITDPLLFYSEVIGRNTSRAEIEDINEQYLDEFMGAFQTALNGMSAEGIAASYIPSQVDRLSRHMADALDEAWKANRGLEVRSVGVASISYDETTKELLKMRAQGAMLSDPAIRQGYVQGAAARGLEASGSNPNGAAAGFMGMGFGMHAAGNVWGGQVSAPSGNGLGRPTPPGVPQPGMSQPGMSQPGVSPSEAVQPGMGQTDASQPNVRQPETSESPSGWTCSCGSVNQGKFCPECGKKRPDGPWICSCGQVNQGKFCSECGKPRNS